VRSEVGVGTTFCLYLPRARALSERASLPPVESVRGGRETVLVVEDDDQVRAVLVRILIGLGYKALEAASGRHALEIVRRVGLSIDLVLTDVVMPEVGGIAVVEALRREQPATRFLFMSGYSEAALRHHPALLDAALMLHKPITPDLLARRVRAALDSNGLGI
jgi:two-component system, cell cycle sensor histidine kinase and response regulator CckA